MSGGARGMGRLLLGAPAAMAGPTRRGVSVTVTARAALHSRSPTPPAATRKRAGTCPGRRSPRCCSWRCPGWGPPAWAACPAGERATGQSGTSAARRPHLQLTRKATPPAWMPGHAPTPLTGTATPTSPLGKLCRLESLGRGKPSLPGAGVPAGMHGFRTQPLSGQSRARPQGGQAPHWRKARLAPSACTATRRSECGAGPSSLSTRRAGPRPRMLDLTLDTSCKLPGRRRPTPKTGAASSQPLTAKFPKRGLENPLP